MALDLTLLSPAQLDKFIHIQSILARQEYAQARVRAIRAYYDGDMDILLTERQKEFIGKFLTEGEFEFAHNTIKSVVDTLRERLNVSGFTVNGAGLNQEEQDANTPEMRLAALFWSWWQENRMDAQQIRLHRRAIRDGASYIIVDYDNENQRPRFSLHKADDGTTGITMHRDPENSDIVLFACKYNYTYNPLEPGKTGLQRKTVYLPGEVRKYIMREGFWAQYADEDGVWPVPWKDAEGKPLGIAVTEFENPGGSEVAQIMGLQNGLNKSWLDLIAASDAAGFPILVNEDSSDAAFAAITDDTNIEGDDEFIVAPGRMLETAGHIHRIEGANLEQLINVIWTFIAAISAVSRTPQHYLRPSNGSDIPSGEALKQLESGLVSRAKERQLIFGQGWADVMAMAYKVERAFGKTSLPDLPKLKIETTWESPETRNDLTEAQTAQIHSALKVPDDAVWALLGYTPQDITKFKAMKRTDQAAAVSTIAQALQQQRAATPQSNQNGNGQQNGNGIP